MLDIIIVGAGPAGLTAAIYARRAGKSVMILEKESFGGQIVYSPKVENYPGFLALSGTEFGEKLVDQAAIKYDVILANEDIAAADLYGIRQAPTLVVVRGGQMEKFENVSNIRRFIEESATVPV